jgi:hypothetical protein
MRVRRGTLRSEKGEDGRVYVFREDLDVDQDVDQDAPEPQAQVEASRELVEVLREQVEDLRARLDRETEANRENRRIIAGLIERVPEIEAPREPSEAEARGGDISVEDEPEASTPAEPRPTPEEAASRPWWRRIFGE